jgi:hypothetical protein
MNQLYLISTDGEIFCTDAKSKYYKELKLEGAENVNDGDVLPSSIKKIKIKHLSSSDWCLWCISDEFKIYLYVFKLDMPHEFQEIIYENEVKLILRN